MKRNNAVRLAGAVLLIGACGALPGCTSTAERRVADEERCRSYGFRPGTDSFSKCLLDLDLNRDADRRAVFNGPYAGVGFGYGVGPRRLWW